MKKHFFLCGERILTAVEIESHFKKKELFFKLAKVLFKKEWKKNIHLQKDTRTKIQHEVNCAYFMRQ